MYAHFRIIYDGYEVEVRWKGNSIYGVQHAIYLYGVGWVEVWWWLLFVGRFYENADWEYFVEYEVWGEILASPCDGNIMVYGGY